MADSFSPEQWEQVQRLFDEVVELAPEAQTFRLKEACGSDSQLYQQVESLLEAYAQADDILQDVDQLRTPPPQPMRSSSRSGTHISHYRVQERLGGGGMGEVYKAHDEKLGRTVALKFLTASLSHDDDAKARFAHEARAASALDHPNIGTIHDIGETDDGQLFIAMAYYPGKTLKEKVADEMMSQEAMLDYTVQIARGLATAHAQGIVHRDIKPANIMVTEPSLTEAYGLVKIVDFGLAKIADITMTKTGHTLGTVPYMSPEQARGEVVDHQTDVWSLGVVLYEMLTGVRPFSGDYEQAVIYGVLNQDPAPVSECNPAVAVDLERVVAKCLEKKKGDRYPTMADLLADLEVLQQGGTVGLPSPVYKNQQGGAEPQRPIDRPLHQPKTVPRWVPVGLGILVSLIVLVVAVPALRQAVPGLGDPAIPAQRKLAVLPFDNIGDDPENQAFIDGLVYTVTSKLTEMEQFQDALSVVPARDVLQAGLLSTRAAAEQFKVNLVLSGSVQRTARSGVRITLELVDLKKDKVTSRHLDQPIMEIMALQDGVVFKLAELLELELDALSQKVLTAGRTAMPVAYDFYTQGLGYLQRFEDESNIDAAISLFELAIKEDTAYALAYAGLGEAFLRKYKASNEDRWVGEAIYNGERAVDLDEDLAPVQVTLGMIYNETGRYDKAELAYLRALTSEPNNAAAHHQLGKIYQRRDKAAMAEESYEEAITLKPGYWLFHNDLGQFYAREGRHEEAILKFKEVIALQPDNPWGYNNVGAQFTRLGRVEEAITWYEEATRINPNAVQATAYAFNNLAGIYYAQDRFGEAAQMYEKAVDLQQELEVRGAMGDAYYWSGEREAARAAWRYEVELARGRLAVNPHDAETLGLLAEDYARLGTRDSTYAVLDRLLALDERSAEALLSIGKAYEIMKERDQALSYIEAALNQGYTPAMLEFSAWLDDLRADSRYQALMQAYENN